MKADVKIWRFLLGWLSIWPALSLAWIMGVCLTHSESLYKNIMLLIAHPQIVDSGADFRIKRSVEEFVELAFMPPLVALFVVFAVGAVFFIIVHAVPVWYLEGKNDLKDVVAAVRIAARWAKAKLNKG